MVHQPCSEAKMDSEKLRQAAKALAVGCIEDSSIDLPSIIDQGFRDAVDQKIAELSQIENSYKNIVGSLSLINKSNLSIVKPPAVKVCKTKSHHKSPKKKTSREQIVFHFIKNEKKLLEDLIKFYGQSEGQESAKDFNWFKSTDAVSLLWKKFYHRSPSEEQIKTLRNPLRMMLISLEKKNKAFRKGNRGSTLWAIKGLDK